jgi:hypothetical protein
VSGTTGLDDMGVGTGAGTEDDTVADTDKAVFGSVLIADVESQPDRSMIAGNIITSNCIFIQTDDAI